MNFTTKMVHEICKYDISRYVWLCVSTKSLFHSHSISEYCLAGGVNSVVEKSFTPQSELVTDGGVPHTLGEPSISVVT